MLKNAQTTAALRAQGQNPLPTLLGTTPSKIARPVVRLIIEPERRPGFFVARLDQAQVWIPEAAGIVARSRQPLVDGARALLEAGHDPAAPLALRHAGKTYDSFRPLPIGELARWTYWEGEKRALQRARWMPRADMAGGQKSTSPVGPEELAEDAAQRRLAGGLA